MITNTDGLFIKMKYLKDDIEWIADEGNWGAVFKMINTGTSKIESIKYR